MIRLLSILTLLLPTAVLACGNTSYSAADEREITNDVRLLVIGAFAHHGQAFYEHDAKRCRQILAQQPQDFEARNDLAMALTKLGQYSEAEHDFLRNEKLHPGRYKTASNLGVLYKKWGKYDSAATWIGKALEIRPEGHMGLGDYYKRMIQWRRQYADETEPKTNFLGIAYAAGPDASAEAANKTYVITLIKNDMNFADSYLVLGDIAQHEGDFPTAIRCYLRAADLGHSFDVQSRIDGLQQIWQDQRKFNMELDFDWGTQKIVNEFRAAEKWLRTYQSLEEQRLAASQSVDFRTMKLAVAQAGLESPKIMERVHYHLKMEEVALRSFHSVVNNSRGLRLVMLVAILGLCVVSLRFKNPTQPVTRHELADE